MKKEQAELRALARGILYEKKVLDEHKKEFDSLTKSLKSLIGPEGGSVKVPEEGEVKVSRLSQTEDKEVLKVSDSAFYALDKKVQRDLIRRGVVVKETKKAMAASQSMRVTYV